MGSIYILFCVNALMHNFYKWESHMHNPGMGSLLNFSEKTPTNIYIFVSPGIKFIGLCHNIRKEEEGDKRYVFNQNKPTKIHNCQQKVDSLAAWLM